MCHVNPILKQISRKWLSVIPKPKAKIALRINLLFFSKALHRPPLLRPQLLLCDQMNKTNRRREIKKKKSFCSNPGTGFTNISTIFLSFFYLFSKLLLNCFQLLRAII
jgi:hypothetical protein